MNITEIPIDKPATLSKFKSQPYSFAKKLKLRGTGSAKFSFIIEPKNQPERKSVYPDLFNFEIYPNGLIYYMYGNEVKAGIFQKKDIEKAVFNSYGFIVRTRNKTYIKHQAIFQIDYQNESYRFHVNTPQYKSVRNFFEKDWLREKTEFHKYDHPNFNQNISTFEMIIQLLIKI